MDTKGVEDSVAPGIFVSDSVPRASALNHLITGVPSPLSRHSTPSLSSTCSYVRTDLGAKSG